MMNIQIYNTETRRKQVLQPIEPGRLKMYVCGPTVYDYIHIGNARPVIVFDVVRKFLAKFYDIRFIMNFTDVDDKLIRKAEDVGKSVPEVASQYIAAFFADIEALGIQKADAHPRVTDHIDEIIAFIESLVEQGYAYEKEGDVYFRTTHFHDYGKLSHQNIEQLQLGARIEVNERKEHAVDFVLWKAAKSGEIRWPSPWGEGRPGWHIECSAMAKKYLGETIDIHGGGSDLQFPHHECEVAQSEALHKQPLANIWMHNGYIHINNEKMSKSLGNGVNVNDILKRFKPESLRYLMLSTHYRNPLNYSEQIMAQCEQSIARIENCLVNLKHRRTRAAAFADDPAVAQWKEAIQRKDEQFNEKMADDFNTPDAMTVIFELVGEANSYLKKEVANRLVIDALIHQISDWNSVMGIIAEPDELLDEEIENLIEERIEARKNKNFQRADEIRDLLQQKEILLEDTPQGTRWRRK